MQSRTQELPHRIPTARRPSGAHRPLEEGRRHPRLRRLRAHQGRRLLRAGLGTLAAARQGDPRRDPRAAEGARASATRARRAPTSAGGSCSTTRTSSCTSCSPRRASTTTSTACTASARSSTGASRCRIPALAAATLAASARARAESAARGSACEFRRAPRRLRSLSGYARHDVARVERRRPSPRRASAGCPCCSSCARRWCRWCRELERAVLPRSARRAPRARALRARPRRQGPPARHRRALLEGRLADARLARRHGRDARRRHLPRGRASSLRAPRARLRLLRAEPRHDPRAHRRAEERAPRRSGAREPARARAPRRSRSRSSSTSRARCSRPPIPCTAAGAASTSSRTPRRSTSR